MLEISLGEERWREVSKEKGSIKLSSFTDDITAYAENSVDSTKNLLELISEFGKTARSIKEIVLSNEGYLA